jgi:PilZ domain
VQKAFNAPRVEKRVPMAIAVHISGHEELPGVETTFTENVSARGARVLSVRRWNRDDRISFESLPGNFRAKARVTYCERLRDDGYAVGLEFLEPAGHWVLGPLTSSENNLHG